VEKQANQSSRLFYGESISRDTTYHQSKKSYLDQIFYHKSSLIPL